MADLCCIYTYAGLTINDFEADGLVLLENGVTGLDGAPIRSQIDPKGQTDGGIVHTKHFGPRIITFTGAVLITSVTDRESSAYMAALNTVESAVVTALEAALNTESALAWTPEGLAAHSINASYGNDGGEVNFSGLMVDKRFTFTLVAENPDISGA